MPDKKRLREVGSKEQRTIRAHKEMPNYRDVMEKWAKEVAARTVMKQHQEKGHCKGQQRPRLVKIGRVSRVRTVPTVTA